MPKCGPFITLAVLVPMRCPSPAPRFSSGRVRLSPSGAAAEGIGPTEYGMQCMHRAAVYPQCSPRRAFAPAALA